MAEYLIQDTTLTGIADAIRGKTGGTDPVAVSDMAAQIEGIQTGGGGGDALNALIDRSITEISSNSATSIGNSAFSYCSELTMVNFLVVTSIETSAFESCNKLTTVDFPVVTSIGSRAFHSCTSLTTIDFPVVTSIGNSAFYYCTSLPTADFPVATTIGTYAFSYCSVLKSLLLRGNNVCTLSGKNAFNSTPIKSGTGYIYVPSALIEQYKVATNWSTYAAQFRALEDYTVDGTVTGELDPAKTGT